MTAVALLKFVHVACVVLTFIGFVGRGLLMMVGSPLLRARWLRVAPHVVDTLLLASAVLLAVNMQQFPGVHAWLTAKVAGLIGYILLGMVALRWGRTRTIRIGAWLGALAVFGYIVAVALTHDAALGLV